MKILIGNYVLAEGARDSDEEPETSASQVGQVAQFFRAANAGVYPRGNRIFTFSFSKTTSHADFMAAERFRLLHPIEIPTDGLLSFVTEDGAGSEAAIYFTQHNLDQVRVRQIGVATITTYTITAARPTTTRPAST